MRRALVLVLAFAAGGGCATAPQRAAPPGETTGSQEEVAQSTAVHDPWERFNRGVYRFNARFDEAIFLPVANGYRKVVPRPVRRGLGNAFANLGEVPNTANHLLQGRPGYGVRSAGRFLVNSTLGLAGFFDVASHLGLTPVPTSFGNTLGRWGVGPGPYLVVPLLGPSTLRDGAGQLFDFGVQRGVDAGGLYTSDNATAIGAVYMIDGRARNPFRYYETGSPFEYELIRFLYTRKRALEIEGTRALPDAPPVAPPPPAAEDEDDAAMPLADPLG
ncbi:VacJ family lipoprotein [Coralloluteibacterium thermophilus]|uniref:VacJ family lipoprotein n=1 Tax=Coralloluteibacterium thermophilum TaxID=2707049 RepID=A0ABV9NHP2_9GAMM